MMRVIHPSADKFSSRPACGDGAYSSRPKVSREDLSIDLLKQHLRYDDKSGIFYRLISSNMHPAGSIAGSYDRKGYIRIRLFNVAHGAHRLAWFYMYGVWPRSGIDHIDGNPRNNAIENLREANNQQNQHNRLARGFYFDSRAGRFAAKIRLRNGQHKHLGFFDRPEQAQEAYLTAHAQNAEEFSFVHRISEGAEA